MRVSQGTFRLAQASLNLCDLFQVQWIAHAIAIVVAALVNWELAKHLQTGRSQIQRFLIGSTLTQTTVRPLRASQQIP
jgi:hypothetical protein